MNLDIAKEITEKELSLLMNYCQWDEEKISKGRLICDSLSNALMVIIRNVPPSADRSNAIRKIREARMDCNSAITHDGKF